MQCRELKRRLTGLQLGLPVASSRFEDDQDRSHVRGVTGHDSYRVWSYMILSPSHVTSRVTLSVP